MPNLTERMIKVESDVASANKDINALGAKFSEAMDNFRTEVINKIDSLSLSLGEKFEAVNEWIKAEPKRRDHYDRGWQDGVAGLERTTNMRHEDNVLHQKDTENRLARLELLAIQQKTSVRVVTILASVIVFLITVGGAVGTMAIAAISAIWWISQHVPIK